MAVLPVWVRFGRSKVGLAGGPLESWPAFALGCLPDGSSTVPLDRTSAQALRFLADHLKALSGETLPRMACLHRSGR